MADQDRFPRRRAAVVLAAVTAMALLGAAGCSSEAEDKSGTAGASPSTAPSSPAAGAGGGDIVKAAVLSEYRTTMPAPKGAPKGIWSEPMAPSDGHELVNYIDENNKGYVGITFTDCRLPGVQAAKDKAASEQDKWWMCLRKPTGTVKGYPLILAGDAQDPTRSLVVNHISVTVVPWVGFEQFTSADVEALLGSLDLAALAKM